MASLQGSVTSELTLCWGQLCCLLGTPLSTSPRTSLVPSAVTPVSGRDPLSTQVPPAPGAAVPAAPAASSPGNPEQAATTALQMPPVPKAKKGKESWRLKDLSKTLYSQNSGSLQQTMNLSLASCPPAPPSPTSPSGRAGLCRRG